MDYKNWLKYKDLEYQDGVLHIANMSTIELAKKYGTPLYVINEQMIRKRYQALKNTLNSIYEDNTVHFAMKANSSLSVLKILESEGASFDCSSKGEVYTCLQAGISPEKIIYTGNMFTNDDFEYAVKNDVLVNLDSISQLIRLARIHDKLGKEKNTISFRINPEFGAGHHVHTITAGKEIKFGILDNQVIEAYSKAKQLGFKKFGTHIHIGSGILNPQDFEKATEKYLSIIMNLADTLNIQLDFVDFGGGIGIPYRPEEDSFDLAAYKEIVIKRFLESFEKGNMDLPNLKVEPGRYLSAEASILITQINTVKNNGYKLFAGVDAGFNTLVRPTMYGSYHHIISCEQSTGDNLLKYDIAGPICESGDILGRERMLPKLKEEEYLAILDTGAYGYIMTSRYNSRPAPAEVLVNDETHFLIREAETFDDLLKKQIIPEHLK
ncbi:MAG: diaminopimelate decarboxylase [Promethearchaeota archaeon]|nr:MAG: diaminopimelate decarboxylase [Candidatus Lokiarchaeota archaeon]